MLNNIDRISDSFFPSAILLLSRKTDWYKLLQLPDVSWLQLLVAAACMVVVIWAIIRLVSRVNEDVDPAEADREMLQALSDLRREGDLTEDEFRSIKGQITGRLNTAWTGSARPDAAARNAGKGLAALKAKQTLEGTAKSDSDSKEGHDNSAESNESETFASPTDLHEPVQEPSDLAKRQRPPTSENGEGKTEAESKEN